jgi:hypothetical protein
MDNVHLPEKKKFNKDDVYPGEKEIEKDLGKFYSNTLNHRMKDKNTCKSINPTYGLYNEEFIYQSTNQVLKPTALRDPYLNKRHYFTTDINKRFNEELFRRKNLFKILDQKSKESLEKAKK